MNTFQHIFVIAFRSIDGIHQSGFYYEPFTLVYARIQWIKKLILAYRIMMYLSII